MRKQQQGTGRPAMIESLEDRTFLSASHKSATVLVNKTPTSLLMGQQLVLTAKLASNGLPLRTATVQFFLQGQTTAIGSAVTGRSGYAQLTINGNPFAGTYPIVATFAGATKYKASTSAADNLKISFPNYSTAADGLKVATVEQGTGASTVGAGNTISVDYSGYLSNGTEFDTSYKTSPSSKFTFQVGTTPTQSVPGFDEGVRGMKIGETRVIDIPANSQLGYADHPPQGSGIPNFAELIFVVTLRSIT